LITNGKEQSHVLKRWSVRFDCQRISRRHNDIIAFRGFLGMMGFFIVSAILRVQNNNTSKTNYLTILGSM